MKQNLYMKRYPPLPLLDARRIACVGELLLAGLGCAPPRDENEPCDLVHHPPAQLPAPLWKRVEAALAHVEHPLEGRGGSCTACPCRPRCAVRQCVVTGWATLVWHCVGHAHIPERARARDLPRRCALLAEQCRWCGGRAPREAGGFVAVGGSALRCPARVVFLVKTVKFLHAPGVATK